ncbi:MAG: PQQ-binding-like beta-propeller repeat protein [Methanoregulaceae archaeon]|nr:PQQ-binding-like beta-propeller repeat protein [Methanoregulaceae archaeon]
MTVVATSNTGASNNSGMGPKIIQKWSYPTGIIESPPVMANGIVYAGSVNHTIYVGSIDGKVNN